MIGPSHYTLPKDSRTCMCSVCTCGQHHCPGLMKSIPLDGNTHYRDTFTPKKAARDDSPRKLAMPLSTKASPEHYLTTYQNANDLLKKSTPDRAQSYRPTRSAAPQAPFHGETTQRSDYTGHRPAVPPPPARVEPMARLAGTYDTTLGAMQKPVEEALKNGPLLRAASAKVRAMPIPQVPFHGASCYQEHYPAKSSDILRKGSPRQQLSPQRSADTRDFQTTKGSSYMAPPPRQLAPCPAMYIPQQPPSRDGHIKVKNEDEFRAKVAAMKC